MLRLLRLLQPQRQPLHLLHPLLLLPRNKRVKRNPLQQPTRAPLCADAVAAHATVNPWRTTMMMVRCLLLWR